MKPTTAVTATTTTTVASSCDAPPQAPAAAIASDVPAPPPLRSSISIGSSRALAALSTLALQAKGLTSVLQRPKFLTTEPRVPPVERKPEATKSLSSSSLSSSAATEDALDDIDARESGDEAPAPSSRRLRLDSADSTTAIAQLLPWELRDEHGTVTEHALVRDKVLELAVYRRTFVEDASGEDEFSFQFARYKDVARRLLLRDPNVREKYATIVQGATFVVSEETFWRNFFLRCNAVCVAAGVAPYLPPVVHSSVAAVASFQRFKRDVFLKTQRSSAELERLRYSLLQSRRTPSGSALAVDTSDPTAQGSELGELELDLDGKIERELVRRRPSRASEYHRNTLAGPPASDVKRESEVEAER